MDRNTIIHLALEALLLIGIAVFVWKQNQTKAARLDIITLQNKTLTERVKVLESLGRNAPYEPLTSIKEKDEEIVSVAGKDLDDELGTELGELMASSHESAGRVSPTPLPPVPEFEGPVVHSDSQPAVSF